MRTVDPEQHALRRAAILAAAAEEFAAHGVHGTSTAAICRRAGIGSGTLFHYFPTKRDIVHALFRDDLPRNSEVCARALAEAQPAAGFDLVIDHLLAELADPLAPGLAAAAMFQANIDEGFARLLAAGDDQIRAVLTTLLERMSGQGWRPAFAPDRVARWIQSLIDACYLTGDDHDPGVRTAELRQVIACLVRRERPGRAAEPDSTSSSGCPSSAATGPAASSSRTG